MKIYGIYSIAIIPYFYGTTSMQTDLSILENDV